MRSFLALLTLTAVACAGAPAPATSKPVAAAPAPPPAPAKAPPALEEPLGAAAARISGPAAAFTAACQEAMTRAKAGLDAVKSTPAPRDTVATLTAYDDANAAISDAGAQAELARQGSPNPAMRKAAEGCDRQLQAMFTAINQDRALYDVLSSLDLSGQDVTTRWWITRDLREFRRAGVDRDDATRGKVRALADELVALGQEFDRNIPADVRKVAFSPADLAGMPADFLAAHPPGPDGKIVLTTDYPDYFPVRSYARKASTREAMWRAFTSRAAPQNIALLEKMLVKRQELARTLGYANWADFVTENKMIRTGKAASDFIERITAASGSRAAREKQLLLDRKRKDVPGAKALDPWDVVYYGERVKAERYHFDAQKARPYFEASQVFQGVLDVSAKLFDVSYRPVENAVVWHPDVRSYDVIAGPSFGDGAGNSLGRVYLDMHPREGKYKHAAQFTVISGTGRAPAARGRAASATSPSPARARADGARRGQDVLPRVRPPAAPHPRRPHPLGGALGRRDRAGLRRGALADARGVGAAIRACSQSFAKNVKTGEPIPAEMVARLRAARGVRQGALRCGSQMFYAAISLELHDRRGPRGSTRPRWSPSSRRSTRRSRHVEGHLLPRPRSAT